MTTKDQILKLKKELSAFIGSTNKKIAVLEADSIAKTNHSKTTRYYPNGAYMEVQKDGEGCYFLSNENEICFHKWVRFDNDNIPLLRQNCFPTEEAAEKELNRQKLTSKMYRDMRDGRINGDWVAGWNDLYETKYYPYLSQGKLDWAHSSATSCNIHAHNFYYKNDTFIEDLKAMGWTEEELKIVWFNI